MIFQRKVDRALDHLHEQSDAVEAEKTPEFIGDDRQEMLELEKNDFLAMVIAALITIIPVALIVLAGIVLVGYFLFMH